MTTIASIVEGHGEVSAVPELLRRVAYQQQQFDIKIAKPLKISRGELVNRAGELERAARLAVAEGATGLIVLLDADRDCPAELGPTLAARVSAAVPGTAAGVVVAKVEFEAWFLASAPSLRGKRGLRTDLQAPPDAEAVTGAKEWLTRNMVGGKTYKETLDQVALAAEFDLDLARTAASFDKFYRDVQRVLEAIKH